MATVTDITLLDGSTYTITGSASDLQRSLQGSLRRKELVQEVEVDGGDPNTTVSVNPKAVVNMEEREV